MSILIYLHFVKLNKLWQNSTQRQLLARRIYSFTRQLSEGLCHYAGNSFNMESQKQEGQQYSSIHIIFSSMQSAGNILNRRPCEQPPIIQRIQTIHQKNKSKEYLVKKTKDKHMDEFEQKKSNQNENRMRKNEQIMAKVHEQHQKLKESIKRKQEHLQLIFKKSHKFEQEKYRLKVKKIKQRQAKYRTDKQNSIICFLRKNQRAAQTDNNSQTAKSFYQKAHNKQLKWSLMALQKNLSKQSSAEKNRKGLQQSLSKLKQINYHKIERKIRADSKMEEKYQYQLKRSVQKIQSFLNRSFQSKEKEEEQKKQKEKRDRKHFQKVHKLRQNLLADISEKFNKVQATIFEKNMKCSEIRQRNRQQSLDQKRRMRETRENQTQANFYDNNNKIKQKMDSLYQKDRQKWGFVTSITAFKERLIQKNVYESSQIALILKA